MIARMWSKTKYPGIVVRHEKACASHSGGKCRCKRSWRVRYRAQDGQPKWSNVFHSEAEARSWQVDRGRTTTPEAKSGRIGKTFNELFDEWMALVESGAVTQKGGRRYSPGTLDTYRRMVRNHVTYQVGERDAGKLTVLDWQAWLDSRARIGLKRNSISVTLNCVRAVYRWACSPTRRLLAVNPTRGLELPAHDETPRNRVATPEEAKALLSVLTGCDKASYAIALYAGMRNVERKGLLWSDVDFDKARIRVRVTKGEKGAGIRSLPITAPLRVILKEEWLRQGRPDNGLVCLGPKGGAPEYNSMVTRAKKAWKDAGMVPIGFHECRHTFITTMIHAGLNAKAVSVLAGHASIDVTFDRYGHLFPGSEDEAGAKLDSYYNPVNPPAEQEQNQASEAQS